MVRSVGGPSGSHHSSHPQSVTRGQGPKASEGVKSLANRIGNIANETITPAGKHVFSKKAPNSLATDVGTVSKKALKDVGQLFKKAGRSVR